MSRYLAGTTIQVDAEFRDADGVLADPTTVVFTLQSPAGVDTTPTVVNDGVGLRHASAALTTPGLWRYQWVGAGGGVDVADQGTICVDQGIT
jgi:hypothetical protein